LFSLDIIYEDNHLLVVNKPAGLLVQGDQTGDPTLLDHAKEYLKKKYNKPGAVYLGLVHRLDRPTSGVIVLARTSKALSRLNQQFKDREPKKTYWALVEGKPQEETKLLHFLKRNSKLNKSFAHKHEVPESKKAVLEYKCIKRLNNYSLLEIDLHTGRHHQIRAQLSAERLFIKGDLKYGAKRPNSDGSIHLLARTLEITHPVRKDRLLFVAKPPTSDGLWDACLSD
jgi:23S rRNA pseudouridine1911/1915/1917 synthase